MLIPSNVVYRIYGDDLAVVMNVSTRTMLLLQHEALRLWRSLDADPATSPHPGQRAIYRRLVETGMISAEAAQRLDPNATESSGVELPAVELPAVELGVVNYWAFKNHIPISGHFELTNRCNLRCKHCYCVTNRHADTLDTDQVVRIIDELQRCGTLALVLTGGEIFVRRDILEILRHLGKQRFVVRLNTNGTYLTEKVIAELAALPNIYRVHVSLYGSRPEIHEHITGAAGSFDKTVRAIHALREAGIALRVNCSLMGANFHDLHDLHQAITEKLSIPIRFDPFIFPRDDGLTDNLTDSLDERQHADFLEFLRWRDGDKAPGEGAGRPKLCKAGYAFFAICEDGRVFPCLKMKRYYKNPLGSLSKESFAHIWDVSRGTRAIRDSLDGKLRECDICDLVV